MLYDKQTIEQMDSRYRAHFINALTGYKSANLIGTVSESGIENLAIFSSVFHLGAHPPLIGMISRPDSVTRDTLANIKQTGSYTINHVGSSFIKAAHQTSARYDEDISEFDMVGLTPDYRNGHIAPHVNESPCSLSMMLREYNPLEINGTVMIIGEIIDVYVEEHAIRHDGSIDVRSLKSVSVTGLDEYHSLSGPIRLSYAKADKTLDVLE